MSLEEILDILIKNFVHFDLNKKETKELQIGLDKFIKVIKFTICFHSSSFFLYIKHDFLL